MARIESRVDHWEGAQGIRLAYQSFGAPSGSPVILVHGGGQSRYAWTKGARVLASAGFLAIAIDMRGHGESDWAVDGDYSPQTIASDIQALMRLLERPAVLVGASRGGYATLIAAARNDPSPLALVLVEIAPRIDQSGADQVRAFMNASSSGFESPDEAAELLRIHMGRIGRTGPELQRSMRQDESGRWFWRWDPRMAIGTDKAAADVERQLENAAREITAPMLLVRGEHSELVKSEHAAHLKSVIPHAKIVTIAGAGHMISGDENDLFNAAILDFIAGLMTDENSASTQRSLKVVRA